MLREIGTFLLFFRRILSAPLCQHRIIQVVLAFFASSSYNGIDSKRKEC